LQHPKNQDGAGAHFQTVMGEGAQHDSMYVALPRRQGVLQDLRRASEKIRVGRGQRVKARGLKKGMLKSEAAGYFGNRRVRR